MLYHDAHSVQVVQRIYQPLQVATVAHLIRTKIMFKSGAVGIVVAWVAIDESVQE